MERALAAPVERLARLDLPQVVQAERAAAAQAERAAAAQAGRALADLQARARAVLAAPEQPLAQVEQALPPALEELGRLQHDGDDAAHRSVRVFGGLQLVS